MKRIEPERNTDERTMLLQFLEYQRATLLRKVDGLDAAQLRQRLPNSTLSLGGLLKHLALVEDDWLQFSFLNRPESEIEPWASAPFDEDRDWDFHSADADDPDDLRDLYRAACERSRQVCDGRDLDSMSTGADPRGQGWSLRWIICHLIEETARHNGHADLLREAIDGTVGE